MDRNLTLLTDQNQVIRPALPAAHADPLRAHWRGRRADFYWVQLEYLVSKLAQSRNRLSPHLDTFGRWPTDRSAVTLFQRLDLGDRVLLSPEFNIGILPKVHAASITQNVTCKIQSLGSFPPVG